MHIIKKKGRFFLPGGKAVLQSNCILTTNDRTAFSSRYSFQNTNRSFSLAKPDNVIWWQGWLRFSSFALRLKPTQAFPRHMLNLVICFLNRCLCGFICCKLLINYLSNQCHQIFKYFPHCFHPITC